MTLSSGLLRRRVAAATVVAVCLSALGSAWLGYVAVREWQESVAALAEREVEEASDLLVSAIIRDMRAVQRSVLSSPALEPFTLRPPYEAINMVASAFARYQYPESFILWRRDSATPSVWLLHRRERPPAWANPPEDPNVFPLTLESDAAIGRVLLSRIRVDAEQTRRFSVFEILVDGVPYQVVARLFYSDAAYEELDAVLGFTVNLDWVRQNYFSFLLRDAVWVLGARTDVLLTVTDEEGLSVSSTGTGSVRNAIPSSERPFPLMFFSPLMVAADPPSDLPRRDAWSVQALMRDDSSLVAALKAGPRLFALQGVAAGTLALGLLLVVRAWRARLNLADLQSEFVSSVTHEFKTPIATIQAAAASLSSGRISRRVDSSAAQREYAGFIVQEARRLSRLVDNLLTFSRLADSGVAQHHFEPVALPDLVAGTLKRFELQLAAERFDVDVDLPARLPPISGDASAIGLMLDNLVDNVIRHSKTGRRLRIRAFERDNRVVLEVADNGVGIPDKELKYVIRKFYRGGGAGQGGTGLGLAIVNRIVTEHGGILTVQSDRAVGATVSASFPALSKELSNEKLAPSGASLAG